MRPTDQTDPDLEFLKGVRALAEHHDLNSVVLVLHAVVTCSREMADLVGMNAKCDVARREGTPEELIQQYRRKRSYELRSRYGEIVIECCWEVISQHAELKNAVEALMARHSVSVNHARALFISYFPFTGYVWGRYGAVRA